MKVLEEGEKNQTVWYRSDLSRAGIGRAWRQSCEIAGGGKALFIKAYSVKWHFFPPLPQIKMLKHNKCTVHLTSSQAPSATQSPLCPTESLFLLSSKLGCCLARVCVKLCTCACVCVCVCARTHKSPLGQKNYRNWELLALD